MTTDFVQAHKAPPKGMVFYDSLESVKENFELLGYWSVIERAWDEMKLDGVLFIDNRPTLYLKEHDRPFSTKERVYLQKLFWNQGVANILVLGDPKTVYIYSGFGIPHHEESDKSIEKGLIKKIALLEYVQDIQAMYYCLATGRYYEVHKSCFDPEQSADRWLLDNLRSLREALTKGKDGLSIKDAHAFIGRVLFLCYLLDRKIISVGMSELDTGSMTLASQLKQFSYEEQVNYLYGLFNHLKIRFNGNMFDQDLNTEKSLIQASHLEKLVLFLGGHSVKSGQYVMGFWAYDFKMIPIETISAIYQDFLGNEDSKTQRERGAFYTPRFLVEMVIDAAMFSGKEPCKWFYLDPACGSGIFLVTLFNRLANYQLSTQKESINYKTKAEILQNVLSKQIRGVDIEETSCRISCFSLYLAYLDFFNPPDIEEYMGKTGESLPKLLNYREKEDQSKADIPVVHKADFLKEDIFEHKIFDCIIGNPPWKGRQGKQLAQKFLEKVPLLIKDRGVGCFLLPSKIIQNQTNSFQSTWLREVTLEQVIQLADYRFLLFDKASCPAIIARFTNTPPQINHHKIEFNAPKFNRNGLRKGIIIVNPSASSWISLASILESTKKKIAPLIWKRHLWGTPRDQKFLDLLQSLPNLQSHADILSKLKKHKSEKTKRWVIGQGLKPWPLEKNISSVDNPKKVKYSLETRFIETSSWHSDLLLMFEDTISFEERLRKKGYRTDILYSQPSTELFTPPMVLVNHGFSKVAFCDFDILFQHSLQSIAGPLKDANLLKFLTVYLRSNLAKYFLFHTAANWGSERDKVHLFELLRIPFPLPGNEFISTDSEQIIIQIAQKIDQLATKIKELTDTQEKISNEYYRERKKLAENLQQESEPLIYEYFRLTNQEIILVEDTIQIFEPSATPTSWYNPTPALNSVQNTKISPYATQGLQAYADVLTDTLNSWANMGGSDYRVCSKGGIDDETGLVIVTVHLSNTSGAFEKITYSEELTRAIEKLYQKIARKKGTLFYERDIFDFDEDRVHIIRPDILMNWTRTAALNDAAKIYKEITMSRRT